MSTQRWRSISSTVCPSESRVYVGLGKALGPQEGMVAGPSDCRLAFGSGLVSGGLGASAHSIQRACLRHPRSSAGGAEGACLAADEVVTDVSRLHVWSGILRPGVPGGSGEGVADG